MSILIRNEPYNIDSYHPKELDAENRVVAIKWLNEDGPIAALCLPTNHAGGWVVFIKEGAIGLPEEAHK